MLLSVAAVSAQDYSNHTQLTQRLKAIESANSQAVKLTSLAKSPGGKDVWVLEIGTGDRNAHPAIAVVGGIDGANLLSVELAAGFAEKLLAGASTDSVKQLLGGTTFYVFPNVNPDATEQYFAKVRYERNGNSTPTDDDRDGRLNEDPFEDFNSDGLITMVRVEDPAGKWRPHPADARVMVPANLEKGETGTHTMVSEGTDNDKDLKYNEDDAGGVHFNKSLTFDPPYFAAGAGEHPVSEPESRAVLDFLYERFNVFTVVSFGPANNLSEAWKYDRSKNATRVPTGITEGDAKQNRLAAELYKRSGAAKDAPAAGPQKGDFVQWAYFHYGRHSFSTPGWWAPKFEIPKDSVSQKKYKVNEDKNTDVDFLRWAEKEGIDAFAAWQKINHPDFPNKNAEVGGFKPFVRTNPPYKQVDKLVGDHTKFIRSLAKAQPAIELMNLKTEALDNGVTRVTITLQNKGLFPASTEIGRSNNWVKLVRVSLNPATGQTVVGGKKVVLLLSLDAGEVKEFSWLVKGKGSLTIEAGAPQTGYKKVDAKL